MDRLGETDMDAAVRGQTVPRAFLRTVEDSGDLVALRWQNEDESWGEWTFREYADLVARAVTGLHDHGVGPGDRIVLMMRNIPAFHIADMAAYFVGATPISIYNSSSAEQVQYLAAHCEARFGLVEDMGFLERFVKVRGDLPELKSLGVLHDPEGLRPDDVFLLEEFLDAEPADLEAGAEITRPEDLATMIYTSGTTGPPKGVMLTHHNLAWTVESLRRIVAEHPAFDGFAGKRLVSYLPMAHIAERMVSHYQQVFLGYEVTCCPDPGQIGAYLRHARPNLVFGVPRVWEKIHAGVVSALGQDPEKEQKFDEAVTAAIPLVEKKDWGRITDEEQATLDFLDEVAFQGVRETLGLDQCELAISGAAPIPADLLRWYRAIGIDLTEVYGLSESSGPMTWTAIRIKPGTVGPAIPGCEVKLAEDGELICRGGNVFQGYFKSVDKTSEVLDSDGWLHSGDIGTVDEDGYFTIVDRKKELIITAGGKNISPANLEVNLKLIDLVGQACVIGDRRPFVSALLVLDPDVAPQWARRNGIEFRDLSDLAAAPEVRAEIERQLPGVMAEFNQTERVKKVHILGEEWLPDSEVLTPTSKLKRRGILQRYAAEIEAMYA